MALLSEFFSMGWQASCFRIDRTVWQRIVQQLQTLLRDFGSRYRQFPQL